MSQWKYFSEASDPLIKGLRPELVGMLDLAREYAKVPFVLTSGFRTPDQNSALNGAVSDSSHLKGLAVDISTNNDDHRLNRILYGLFLAGFDRIGIYVQKDAQNPSRLVPHHVHADIDKLKIPEVTWTLFESN